MHNYFWAIMNSVPHSVYVAGREDESCVGVLRVGGNQVTEIRRIVLTG